MKRFDIELLVRSTLREYTVTPKRIAWLQILDQLEKQEQKRDQRIIFRKAFLFISVFLIGFGSVRNKSIQHLDIPPIPRVENSGTIIPTTVFEVEKCEIISTVANNNASTSKNDQVVVQEKIPQRDVVSEEVRKVELVELNEMLTANKRSLSPGIKVTDAEIESLMQKARKNIENERNLLKQQEIVPAREFLVDAKDIEEETEPKGNSTDVAFNNYLKEFLKIKSAFAN